jgi:hypothetical protein
MRNRMRRRCVDAEEERGRVDAEQSKARMRKCAHVHIGRMRTLVQAKCADLCIGLHMHTCGQAGGGPLESLRVRMYVHIGYVHILVTYTCRRRSAGESARVHVRAYWLRTHTGHIYMQAAVRWSSCGACRSSS